MNRHRLNTRKRRYRGGDGSVNTTGDAPQQGAISSVLGFLAKPFTYIAGVFSGKKTQKNSTNLAPASASAPSAPPSTPAPAPAPASALQAGGRRRKHKASKKHRKHRKASRKH